MSEHEERSLSEQFLDTLMLLQINFYRKKKLPIPINQYALLMVISLEEEMTGGEASDILKISKQQTSSIADRLVSQGFIQKVPDAKDRRRTLLKMTEAGEEIIKEQRETIRDAFTSRVGNLTASEKKALAASITCLNLSIEKMFN